MDKFLELTFILLVLSMIVEKITDFIKEHTKNKFNDERGIQNLSIIVGVITALVARADIFGFYLDSNFQLFWFDGKNDFRTEGITRAIAGSLICGLFLSFGSKFFHDLLQLLMETKNLKRKLVNRGSLELVDIGQVDQYLAGNDIQNIDAFLSEYFKDKLEVVTYKYNQQENRIDVGLRSLDVDIPNPLPVKLPSGFTLLLPVSFQYGD